MWHTERGGIHREGESTHLMWWAKYWNICRPRPAVECLLSPASLCPAREWSPAWAVRLTRSPAASLLAPQAPPATPGTTLEISSYFSLPFPRLPVDLSVQAASLTGGRASFTLDNLFISVWKSPKTLSSLIRIQFKVWTDNSQLNTIQVSVLSSYLPLDGIHFGRSLV